MRGEKPESYREMGQAAVHFPQSKQAYALVVAIILFISVICLTSGV